MKRVSLIVLLLVLLCSTAMADKARFLSSDGNRSYHSSHLSQHLGMVDCRISANYLKVRTSANGSNVLGHVEQADTVELIELSGNWAHIRVTYSAPTSPDSWAGLEGWVDADYVECPCSSSTYYNNSFSGSYPEGEINSSGVNVRELPKSNQRSLFTLSRGSYVVAMGSYLDGGTYFVRVLTDNGRTGFVRQDMISYTGGYTTPVAGEGLPNKGGIGADPGTPTYIPAGAALGVLVHDSTNVRESVNGTVAGRLRKGSQVAILNSTSDAQGIAWYYVSYGNNRRGYIRGDLIEITGTATATAVPTAAPTAVPASQYYGNYSSLYSAYLQSRYNSALDVSSAEYHDIDGDGTPEMFVRSSLGVRGSTCVYTYANGRVVPINTGYISGMSTLTQGVDQDTNTIGGGGEVYYSSNGIGFLGGGSDSASAESYSYYVKIGYVLVPVRTLEIKYTGSTVTYVLDGRTATYTDVMQFLQNFSGATYILGYENSSNTPYGGEG